MSLTGVYCYKRDRVYYKVGALVRRVWPSGVCCYKRSRGYYRVGELVRRVWFTGVYCYKRGRGYHRVGELVRRVLLYERQWLLQSRGIVHGPWQVPGTTKGDKTRVISGERLYEGLFKFT